MNIILLGAPGAGKGTQAEIISKKLSIPAISTGNMLREAMAHGTELGKKVKEFMDEGSLVPDELVISIVADRVAEPDCENGFILDGMPRTLDQAEALEKAGIIIDHVVSIEVDDAEIAERMTGRRVCPQCGSSYHIVANPPKIEGRCNRCYSRLVIRKDDAPETVQHRLDVYHARTEVLKDFYNKLGRLRLVDGSQSIEGANEEILKVIGAKV
jgi:adenylate kinase